MLNEAHKNNWLDSRKQWTSSSVEFLLNGIRNNDRIALSKAITLVESTREEDRIASEQLMHQLTVHAKASIRIGITGVPGVGKSTFIEAFGMELLRQGKKVAVLAIDPSSERTKGSILGDKTRMNRLASEANAYVRPTASSGSLGGVAKGTRESILLCEAFGFDVILIETVGVGQSETMVKELVDFFLLLMLAGAGDELQGIKRGIMEMADALVINKADGENETAAKLARREYQNALHLFQHQPNGWAPKALVCSAIQNKGIAEIWEMIELFRQQTHHNGFFENNRKRQELYWFEESVKQLVLNHFYKHPEIEKLLVEKRKQLLNSSGTAYWQAQEVLNFYQDALKKKKS